MTPGPEWITRKKMIDVCLRATGWEIIPFDPGLDFSSLDRTAVEELHTDNGPVWNMREGDIRLDSKTFILRDPKGGVPIPVPMREAYVPILREMKFRYPADDDTHFFRSVPGEEGVRPDVPFNEKRLRRWWRKVADAMGRKYVSLYPSTKHSTLTHNLANGVAPEQNRYASGHKTMKAYERYAQFSDEARRDLYDKAAVD